MLSPETRARLLNLVDELGEGGKVVADESGVRVIDVATSLLIHYWTDDETKEQIALGAVSVVEALEQAVFNEKLLTETDGAAVLVWAGEAS